MITLSMRSEESCLRSDENASPVDLKVLLPRSEGVIDLNQFNLNNNIEDISLHLARVINTIEQTSCTMKDGEFGWACGPPNEIPSRAAPPPQKNKTKQRPCPHHIQPPDRSCLCFAQKQRYLQIV